MKTIPLYKVLLLTLLSVAVVSLYLSSDKKETPPNTTAAQQFQDKNISPEIEKYPLITQTAPKESPPLKQALDQLRRAIKEGDSEANKLAIDRAMAQMNATNVHLYKELYFKLPDHENYQYAMERFAATWATFAPKDAATYELNAELQIQGKRDPLQLVFAEWFQQAPTEAAQFVNDYPIPEERKQAIEALAYGIMDSQGPKGSIDWIEKQESTRFKEDTAQHLAYKTAEQDPTLAKAWAASLESGGSYACSITHGVADQLAQHDPVATIKWAESLQRFSLRQEAAAAAIRYWAKSDPIAAAKWISTADTDMINDAVLSNYIQGAYRENPEVTLMALEGVRRRETKAELNTLVREYWKATNPKVYKTHYPEETNEQM
ncbi:hypothetical protein MLD52_00770 [Puniceicoccaceae bacterium K14]|nr:hypothetical protein [Puniceicoccaceae bacterium K14]